MFVFKNRSIITIYTFFIFSFFWGGRSEALSTEAVARLKLMSTIDVYVKEDMDLACTDIQGRMAAGGNVKALHFLANGLSLDEVWYSTEEYGKDNTIGSSVFTKGNFSLIHGSIGERYPRSIEVGNNVILRHFSMGSYRYKGFDFGVENSTGAVNGRAYKIDATTFPYNYFNGLMEWSTKDFIVESNNIFRTPKECSNKIENSIPCYHFEKDPNEKIQYFELKEKHLQGLVRKGDEATGEKTLYWNFTKNGIEFEDGIYVLLYKGAALDLNDVIQSAPFRFVNDQLTLTRKGFRVILLAPNAFSVAMGGRWNSKDNFAFDRNYAFTLISPNADVTFNYGILTGAIYAKSLKANPKDLPFQKESLCELGRAMATSGGQVNHFPAYDAFENKGY